MSRCEPPSPPWPALILFALLSSPAGACVAVAADRILARDLASANPRFAALDPSIEIGFSPRPGAMRVLRSGELRALARRHGVDSPLPDPAPGNGDVCFVRLASAGGTTSVEVRRGEPVDVEVHSGAAYLRFNARAESEGRAGEFVLIRNPSTGRVFPATVEAKGKVVVRR